MSRILCLTMIAVALSAADATNSATPALKVGEVTPSGSVRSLHSWELPALNVAGRPITDLRDADLVGDYGQPRWATKRLFTEVRTYVIPKGQVEFEYWLRVEQPTKREKDDAKDSGETAQPTVKQYYEAEFGLGHRLQLDLYQVYKKDGSEGQNKLDSTKFELRYALADWGVLFANPTIYLEWTQEAEGADAIEAKLLTCDSINDRWVWANNLVWEEGTGHARERGQEVNTAVAYLVGDGLSVGLESNLAYVSELDKDRNGERHGHGEVSVGPTTRFSPIPQAHIILTQFVGLNQDTPEASTRAIFGWEF